MPKAQFEPCNPVLRAVAEKHGGSIRIDESRYREAYDPESGTISRRKASAWFKAGYAVWVKGCAVLTQEGINAADRVVFA